jgi:hypothetical protein
MKHSDYFVHQQNALIRVIVVAHKGQQSVCVRVREPWKVLSSSNISDY